MFDDLDDTLGFAPDDTFRTAVNRRAVRIRHRRRISQMAAIVAVSGVLASGIALAVHRRDAAIDRVEVVTNPSVDGALNVLVLGGDADGRGDTAIVVRFAPDGEIRVLTIPRDLFVVGPDGTGGSRINAVTVDGPDAFIAALDRATGIPVDHVVQLDFDGFRDLVDAVGGLQVGILAELRDVHVGLHLQPTECATLDGETALQLVRARYVQYRVDDGAWLNDPMADLGRSARAQILSLAVLDQLSQLDPGLAELDELSQILADHAVLDEELGLGDVVQLGRRLLSAGAERTTTDALPVQAFTDPNGAALLERVGGELLVREFGATDPPPPADPRPGDAFPSPAPASSQIGRCP